MATPTASAATSMFGAWPPQALPRHFGLGVGLDEAWLHQVLSQLIQDPELRAVIAFGSRARGCSREDSDLDLAIIGSQASLSPQQKLELWRRCNRALLNRPVGVDLIVQGWADAERLSQSRWHVMGDIARHGKVLYVAG